MGQAFLKKNTMRNSEIITPRSSKEEEVPLEYRPARDLLEELWEITTPIPGKKFPASEIVHELYRRTLENDLYFSLAFLETDISTAARGNRMVVERVGGQVEVAMDALKDIDDFTLLMGLMDHIDIDKMPTTAFALMMVFLQRIKKSLRRPPVLKNK